MDKDRIAGAAKEIKGSIKETIGKATGDAKLEADGKADKVEGKVQKAVGGLKDAVKNKGQPLGSSSVINEPCGLRYASVLSRPSWLPHSATAWTR
jgi:uncharacterized protein YjbJ (UPF0337 family)